MGKLNQEWLEKNMYLKGMTQLPNLFLDYYRELKMSNEELVAMVHLLRYLQKGSESKAQALSDYLMEAMNLTRAEVNPLLFNMMSKGFFATPASDLGSVAPGEVSLYPLYEKLTKLFSRDLLNPPEKPAEQHIELNELVKAFEQVFRKLTSFDYEKIKEWLDQDAWEPEIIMEALRQASLQRKLSFVYIDRILLNWQMNGWDTLEKIKAADEAFQRRAALRNIAQQARLDEDGKKPTESKSSNKKTGKAGKKKRYEDIVE